MTRRVVPLGRTVAAGILLIATSALLAPTASAATGAEPDLRPTLVAISIMSLPLTGLLVLLLVSLRPLLGLPYGTEPVGVHIASVLAATALLTFLGALLVPYLFLEGADTTLSFGAVGLLDALVALAVFRRYLLLPLPWASGSGMTVGLATVAWGNYALEVGFSQLHRIEELLRLSWAVWLLIFLALLLLETARHHLGGPAAPRSHPLPRPRMALRLGEMLIVTFGLAVGVAVAWS